MKTKIIKNKKEAGEAKSYKLLNQRLQHAIETRAIGFILSDIRNTQQVTTRLNELKETGQIRIVNGSPSICYFRGV